VAKITTGQIYWGAVPFVLIQIVMVGLIIAFPHLVSSGAGVKQDIDMNAVTQELEAQGDANAQPEAAPPSAEEQASAGAGHEEPDPEDPAAMMARELNEKKSP
jgi:hypothetical protein